MTLSFPPFTPTVKWLIAINAGLFLLLRILSLSPATAGVTGAVFDSLALWPAEVLGGQVWQLLTYAFLHADFLHLFGNMLGLWMFGAAMEQTWGTRRFSHLFLSGVLGAAVMSVLLAASGVFGPSGLLAPTVGASGGVYAVLMAFGIVYAEQEIFLFPFPFQIKAKYFIAILIFVTLVFSMQGPSSVAYTAHLGGLLTGYLVTRYSRNLKQPPRAGSPYAPKQEGLVTRWKNAYYRWKRKRTARKFEVYMRKHDRAVYFDEYGNYKGSGDPPQDPDHSGRGPWVN